MRHIKPVFTGLLIVCVQLAFAQKKTIDKADKFYETFFFKDAIIHYEDALSMNLNAKTEMYVLLQLAKSCQYSFQYTQAEEYYQRLLAMYSKEPRPDLVLEYGIMLKFNGKYDEAREQFKRYNKLTDGMDPYGNFHLRSVNWAATNDTLIKPVYVSRTNLDISGQSLGYSMYKNGIVYAHGRRKPAINLMNIFDLDFAQRVDSLHFIPLSSPLFDSIQFISHEGSPSFTADNATMYFTANAAVVKDGKVIKEFEDATRKGIINLKIYEVKVSEGKLGRLIELPFNNKSYNCTHPHISADGNILYFSSDMPGGSGGFDLYAVKKDKRTGKWSSPINLGASVNTEEHDIFPFTFKGTFYFSSKGLNGYGGFDIYSARIMASGLPSTPKNMGRPYNSFRDDITYMSYGDGTTGYICSNRGNDEGDDEVYFFREYPERLPILLGEDMRRFDSIRKVEIASSILKTEQKVEMPPLPDKLIPLPQVPSALAVAPKPIAPVQTNTKSDTNTGKINVEAYAKPLPPRKIQQELTDAVFDDPIRTDNDDVMLNLVFNNVNFEFNKATLLPEMLPILDSAAAFIRQGSTIRLEISAHTDTRGTTEYNKRLSIQRADVARAYLLSKGVPASRILARGFGESMPLNECVDGVECDEDKHSANRRVELKVIR
ncbi:MAG: OmpA family protein [Bacteroidota bacterium]|jgi:outer membrane protein OmpA-like peptidoglycan-associated protein/tetratricopeptide (TPR) repeat protein